MKSEIEYKLGKRFDGICVEALPIILFSYGKIREPLIQDLQGLFRAYNALDIDTFDRHFKQIEIMIDNRGTFASEKERLIQVYYNRSKSYEEMFNDINDKLNKMHEEIQCLKQRKEKITIQKEKKIENIPVENIGSKINGSKIIAEQLIPQSIKYFCSVCGNKLYRKKKLLYCQPPKGCKTSYKPDETGNIPICNICGKLKAFAMDKYYCPICDEKPKGLQVVCSFCSNQQIYSGKGNFGYCRSCKKQFKIKQEVK